MTTSFETLKAMKEAGCRLLIVGYESGDPQILKNIKKGATVERAANLPATATSSDSSSTATSSSACPARPKRRSATRSTSPRRSTCETIQVSIAHAFPGTELYEYARANGFITNGQMTDDGGHQIAHIEYPGLPADYVLEMVHRFYDEYFFRPKAAWRVVSKAIMNGDVKRLYHESKAFLKTRSQRSKLVRDARAQKAGTEASAQA